ncbi:MAG: hypothetical protein GY943_14180 [Chloroflexi bacterium]|nr:hypothetical protein [Chloroflexota bacterium]
MFTKLQSFLQTRMTLRHHRGRWPIVLVLLAFIFFHSAALATSGENVTLVSFSGTPQENGVALFWITATELDTAGFFLTRTDTAETIRLDTVGPNHDGFIPAVGSPTLGAEYTVLDDTAVPATTYLYALYEITLNATETTLATTQLTAGVPPTYTPISPPATIVVQPTALPALANTAVPATSTPNPTQPPTETAVSATTTPLPTNTLVPPTSTSATTLESNETITLTLNNDAQSEPVAIAQAQSTPEDGYPAPVLPTPTLIDAAYPEPVVLPTSANPTPYPVRTSTSTAPLNGDSPINTPVPVIGETVEPGTESETAVSTSPLSTTSGITYLWLGFIVAVLIFATAVLGALLLFVRRH